LIALARWLRGVNDPSVQLGLKRHRGAINHIASIDGKLVLGPLDLKPQGCALKAQHHSLSTPTHSEMSDGLPKGSEVIKQGLASRVQTRLTRRRFRLARRDIRRSLLNSLAQLRRQLMPTLGRHEAYSMQYGRDRQPQNTAFSGTQSQVRR